MRNIKEPPSNLGISVVKEADLTEKQLQDRKRLQALCFPDVDPKEIKEDFYNPTIANVLAYINGQLVGWAGIHQADIEFEGKRIKLGGFGICTHPDWQRKGIASKVSQKAMGFIKDQGCDIAFLSVDLSNKTSVKLHQKTGFVSLPRKFSWTNVHGEVKKDNGGMIAPLNSQELFEYVLNGKDVLYVGKGYW